MNIISTIVPIFTVILIGWAARRKGYMPSEFVEAANRLVYFVAIPALVFKAIAGASMDAAFDSALLSITLGSVLITAISVWGVSRVIGLQQRQMAAVIQGATHGNLGYIGLAVAYYYLGDDGFASASVIAGFMMILQNGLSVSVLQIYDRHDAVRHGLGAVALKIIGNPIIIAAVSGILFSIAAWTLPIVIERSLSILSGLALPMALLIIGASLSFKMVQANWAGVLTVAVFKLVVLPGLGVAVYRMAGISPAVYLPGLILLSSPTATVAYVMAREMHGDVDLAVVSISTTTLMSSVSFLFWLNLAG